MDGDSTATPPPASSTSSPLSSTSPSSQELKATGVVPNLTAPEKRVARGYWWRDEEIKVYDELVAGYKTNAVNWEEVASELARRCPMDPAPARTATQCAARLVNINARRPGARPVQRWTDEGKLALHHAIQTTLAGENRNLSLKFSQGMGDHRKGSAPSTYRRSVPSALRQARQGGIGEGRKGGRGEGERSSSRRLDRPLRLSQSHASCASIAAQTSPSLLYRRANLPSHLPSRPTLLSRGRRATPRALPC
ncbi:hypothetical protein BCR35DRAFT_324954 [Leucosporidium creatinivorum]|uniref:Myb-like domain-containing protein n=1 Tax=Leucosporidium creatinivorum TaxID=106004 RepID=A0A1Y2FGC4_9BASI|nr:hypothetical protein BCR35DRAFT_324954 [Leucosporidium creatinivorum]